MAEEKKVSFKVSNTSLSNESKSLLRCNENSCDSFNQWEEYGKPVEINCSGRYVLSDTKRGKSIVFYEPDFFEKDEASELMDHLLNATNWQMRNVTIRGVEYPQPRLVAWYGEFPYSYSGTTLEPAEMPDYIFKIKEKVEGYLRKKGVGATLNSVLLNLYRHNKDSVSWHSDDELSMGVSPTIASVSLGDTRRFEMRRKLKHFEDESSYDGRDEYFVYLNNGSLLIMDGCMQKDWQHRVPKEYHPKHERINLTFRTVYKVESLPSPDIKIKKAVNVVEEIIDDEKTINSVCSSVVCQTRDLNCVSEKTSSHNVNITLKTEDKANEPDEEQDIELSNSKRRSTLLSNFLDDDTDYSINTHGTDRKNKKLCTDNQNITTKTDLKIKKESACSENDTFDDTELKNLLDYNMDSMNCKSFLSYAAAFKNKVLENIDEFSLPKKAELEVLCRLTDGTQTEENQKVITKRMYFIVDEALNDNRAIKIF